MMLNKTLGTVVIAAMGVALLWVGLGRLFAGHWRGGLPVETVGFVCAPPALVAGIWLCWQAAARCTSPPALAGRIANIACATLLCTAMLAAAVLSIYIYGIS